MPRVSAGERLQRVLAMVPWVAANDGPRIEEVCTRFDCTEAELVEDLELLFMCGLHPYTPDALIDVDVARGRVWIRYADYFKRPLRLTAAEAMTLVAAGNALLAVPGSDPEGPLARGLAKLRKGLGLGGSVDVALGEAPAAVLDLLRAASAEHRQVDIEYYAFGRDEWTRRTIDPYAVFSAGGQWYLAAYCHAVDDERLFRVDRVRDARVLDTTFVSPKTPPDFTVYEPRPDDPRVVLELDAAGRWVVEQYPVETAEELEGGRVRVRLAVSERAWLERLLLRLGPRARILEGDDDVGRTAACRLLARYATVR